MCGGQQVLWANSLLCPEMREREKAGEGEADEEEKCRVQSGRALCYAYRFTQPPGSHIICL